MDKYDVRLEYRSNTQTLVGSKRRVLIDAETGEKFEVDQITKRSYGQKQFWKVYLLDFLQVLGIVESKQLNILIYILEHTNASTNTYIGTYKKISRAINVSEPTIATLFKKLQDAGFLNKIQNGVYQISPMIMMKGSEHKKQLLLNYYQEDLRDKKLIQEDQEHD